eukprot:g40279.t1
MANPPKPGILASAKEGTVEGQRLVLCTYELLYRYLADGNLILWKSMNPPCYHDWTLRRDEPLIHSVIAIWQSEFGITSADTERLKTAHQQLRITEHPEASPNTLPRLFYFWNLLTPFVLDVRSKPRPAKVSWLVSCWRHHRQVDLPFALMLYLAHDLSLAIACSLLSDWSQMVTALLNAVHRCISAGDFTLMREISKIALSE